MPTIPEIKRVRPEEHKIKMLVYGDPGAGKTTFAAGANDHPALGPALFLNFEGGLLSIAGRGDIDAVTITSLSELENVFWAFHSRSSSVSKYKTVVIDSASEIYTLSLREAVEASIKRRGTGSMDFIERGDYGTASNAVNRLFRYFRDLPLHVIATAHAKQNFTQETKTKPAELKEVVPLFPDKLGVQLRGMFDWVHYLYTWEDEPVDENGQPTGEIVRKRGLLTQDRGFYKAKTRGMAFPLAIGDVVDNPSLPEMYDLMISCETGQAAAKYISEATEGISEPPETPEGYVDPEGSGEVEEEASSNVEDEEHMTYGEALATGTFE